MAGLSRCSKAEPPSLLINREDYAVSKYKVSIAESSQNYKLMQFVTACIVTLV